MKAKAAFPLAALMVGVLTTYTAIAVPMTITTAKVLEVSTSAPRDTAFGPLIFLTVKFDKNIGTGCTSNGSGTFAAGQQADAAARDLQHLALSEMRAVATAALLSGRSVRVQNQASCSLIGTQGLDFVTLL
jgi:hypothetical protein